MPQRNTVTFDVPMGFFIPVINLKSEVGHLLHGWTAQSGLKITVSRMTVASATVIRDTVISVIVCDVTEMTK